jgi:hypothetical protein
MIAVLLFALGACAGAPPPAGSVVVTDSAGIRVVRSDGPLWPAGMGWSLDSVEVQIEPEIGDSVFLYGVRGVARLSDGRIVLANRGTPQLLFFSEAGEYQAAVGRRGKGPGEYDPIQGLFACACDTVVVAEMDRLMVLDGEGNAWLQHYPAEAAGHPDVFQPEESPAEQHWKVIDAEGRYMGAVRLPGELHLLSFAGDRLVAIRRDSFDREHVLLFPIRREPGAGR